MKWPKFNYKWGVALGVGGFLLLVGLYALEIPFFNRYFSFSTFLIYSEIFGLILAVAAAWYWGRKISDSYDLMRFRIGMLAAGLIFGPLLFSIINRSFDPWPASSRLVEFAGTDERISGRYGLPDPEETADATTYHVYFYHEQELIRIVFDQKPPLEGVQEGDQIGIIVRRGLFGLEWVERLQTGEDAPSII